MTSIQATANTRISFTIDEWRLEVIGNDTPQLVANAEGLHYGAGFGSAQRLPLEGVVATSQVHQVVLGWQREDEAWHLGLLLGAPLSETRGSRWCGLASWYDPEQDVFRDDAAEAGEALAQLLGVTFTLVPAEPLAPPAPPREMPILPLTVGMWQLTHTGEVLVLTRTQRWRSTRLRNALSNFFWAVVYVTVSLLTLTSAIALPKGGTLLPNPHWLPYIGLIVAGGLVLSAFLQLYRLASEVNRIEFVAQPPQMAGYHDEALRWTFDVRQAQSLYVSEVVKQRKNAAISEHGELNFHLGGGKFHYIARQDDSVPQENDSILPNDYVRPQDSGVYTLRRTNYASEWQAIGLWLAEWLHLDAWYDVRVK